MEEIEKLIEDLEENVELAQEGANALGLGGIAHLIIGIIFNDAAK
jgi:hypothetical protein